MHHSVQLSLSEGLEYPSLDYMLSTAVREMRDCVEDSFNFTLGNKDQAQVTTSTDRSLYWQSPCSAITDDNVFFINQTSCSELQEELMESPLTVVTRSQLCIDPLLSSSWNIYNEDKLKLSDTVESDKVIVERINKDDEEFSVAINHMDDHSYYQIRPIVDSDNSNSTSSNNSSSSSENEDVDVEYVEPEPAKPTRKSRNYTATILLSTSKRKYKRRNTKNTRSAKRTSRVACDKSCHNESERKRRMEQRQYLDELRNVLGLPERAPKMLTLNSARSHIKELEEISATLVATKNEETARKKLLCARISKFMSSSINDGH